MTKKVPFKKSFDTAKKYDKYGSYLLYASTILLIVNFVLSQYTNTPAFVICSLEIANCLTIILFSIIEIAVDCIHFGAETHRREDFVDNSFASCIAEKGTEGYYNNDSLESGLYKMGVNSFESCFFSYEISRMGLSKLWVKFSIIAIIFIFIAICGEHREWLIFIIQLSIPVVLLQQAIKHTLFVYRLKSVLSKYRSLFNGLKNNRNEDCNSEIIRSILEYEAIISWGNILLNDETYNEMNANLSEEWQGIKKRYSIS